jgi:hypothetical protein
LHQKPEFLRHFYVRKSIVISAFPMGSKIIHAICGSDELARCRRFL